MGGSSGHSAAPDVGVECGEPVTGSSNESLPTRPAASNCNTDRHRPAVNSAENKMIIQFLSSSFVEKQFTKCSNFKIRLYCALRALGRCTHEE